MMIHKQLFAKAAINTCEIDPECKRNMLMLSIKEYQNSFHIKRPRLDVNFLGNSILGLQGS